MKSDTYLACVCRHRWSRKSPVKIEEITGAFSQHCGFHTSTADESHSVDWKLLLFFSIFTGLFQLQRCLRCESGRCCSPFHFNNISYHFTFLDFPFMLIFVNEESKYWKVFTFPYELQRTTICSFAIMPQWTLTSMYKGAAFAEHFLIHYRKSKSMEKQN